MQYEFPLLGVVKRPERIPTHLVALCGNSAEAVRLSMQYGKKSARQVSEAIGLEPAQLSRVLCGNAHMPADKAQAFAYFVGNWGWQQWVAHTCGMDLVPRQESAEEKLSRLEAENAELRAGIPYSGKGNACNPPINNPATANRRSA